MKQSPVRGPPLSWAVRFGGNAGGDEVDLPAEQGRRETADPGERVQALQADEKGLAPSIDSPAMARCPRSALRPCAVSDCMRDDR
jgi:hypothetical protein